MIILLNDFVYYHLSREIKKKRETGLHKLKLGVRVFCRHLVLDLVEAIAVGVWVFQRAVVGTVDGTEKGPEGRLRLLADEPRRCVAAELEHARLEAAQEILRRLVRVDFAEDVLVAVGLGHGLLVGTVDFEDGLDYL